MDLISLSERLEGALLSAIWPFHHGHSLLDNNGHQAQDQFFALDTK